jgi:hypothetical protein
LKLVDGITAHSSGAVSQPQGSEAVGMDAVVGWIFQESFTAFS